MAIYECKSCGMSVKTVCGKCDEPLVDGILNTDDGNQVQISECPVGCGKIKSPSCCGLDMTCEV